MFLKCYVRKEVNVVAYRSRRLWGIERGGLGYLSVMLAVCLPKSSTSQDVISIKSYSVPAHD